MPSIRIGAGYRLPEGTDLFGLAEDLRAMAEPVRDRLELLSVARYCSEILDAADLAGEPRPALAVFEAVRRHTDHIRSIHDGSHDCHTRGITFGFFDDPETGLLYLTADTDEREYLKAFDDGAFAEYFPYWDEDDRPPGVTGPEWAERGRIWRRVLLSPDGDRAREGFTLQVGGIRMPDLDLVNRTREILALIPDTEGRVRNHLQSVIDRWHDEDLHPAEICGRMQTVIPAEGQRALDTFKPITLADLMGETS